MTRSIRRIGPGSRVRLHLAINLEDGTEVLSTFGDDPIEFAFGDGTLAEGLESMLLDLKAGDDERILAEGAAVYGPWVPDLHQTLDRRDLPAAFGGRPGEVYSFDAPGGQQIAGTVLRAAEDAVDVDFNHPLSRRGLVMRVQVLSVD